MLNQKEIGEAVERGRVKLLPELISAALASGAGAKEILDGALIAAMANVGEKFKKNEIFIPEVMMSARAMQTGVDILRPHFSESDNKGRGKCVIGTVKGDLHDIGKNIVKIMLEGSGLTVVDLGTDVSPEKFLDTAEQEGCRVILLSALLTNTMKVMGDVVSLAKTRGVREKYKIMVGGAPVSQAFADSIGADAYSSDAASAAAKALAFCGE